MDTWTTRDGTRLAYRRAGQGPGTILVHGGFIDGSSMTDLMQELASSSRTAFAPDRRGHGASSPYDGPHSFADDVADMVGFSQHVVEELGEAVELVAHTLPDVTSPWPPRPSRRCLGSCCGSHPT